MITVIIPALNEEKTISQVVKFCFAEKQVSEVIVVDDKSTDQTREMASVAGAKVLISAKKGKGYSMKEGILAARNQVLVFLDADIHPYHPDTISMLAGPIINGECDFVKGAFSRNAGRVTELVAKPLLRIFYPELSVFQQPLSGMIAGKKNMLSKVDFFHDYGVDIGILIDMYLMQARVKEVNIGHIENKSRPWEMLGKMSGEVARAVIKKATQKSDSMVNLEELGTVDIISNELGHVIRKEIQSLRKLVVFDMDNTLLIGSFIEACAEKYAFKKELDGLRMTEKDPAVLTKRIAGLLKGLPMGELLQVASSIPVVNDAAEIIERLREEGNIVGIISDSYQFVVECVKNKLGADFALANHLEFFEGIATGEVTIPSYFYYHLNSRCWHNTCKTNVLMHIAHKYRIPVENSVAIGDGENDLCMIGNAGMGIAFCTDNKNIRCVADKSINRLSFSEIFDSAGNFLQKRRETDMPT